MGIGLNFGVRQISSVRVINPITPGPLGHIAASVPHYFLIGGQTVVIVVTLGVPNSTTGITAVIPITFLIMGETPAVIIFAIRPNPCLRQTVEPHFVFCEGNQATPFVIFPSVPIEGLGEGLGEGTLHLMCRKCDTELFE